MSNPPQSPASTPPGATPINIEFPANLLTQYANFALIMHTPGKIIVNFASIMPGMPSAPIHTRIVMTPLHAKMMLNALAENLQKYEAQFGEIKQPAADPGLAAQFFGHIRPSLSIWQSRCFRSPSPIARATWMKNGGSPAIAS